MAKGRIRWRVRGGLGKGKLGQEAGVYAGAGVRAEAGQRQRAEVGAVLFKMKLNLKSAEGTLKNRNRGPYIYFTVFAFAYNLSL